MSHGRLLQMSGVVVDLVHLVDRLPLQGEDVEAIGVEAVAGGGFNAMFAARRLGIEVGYGGPLGTGVFSEIAQRALRDNGIHPLLSRRAADDQGTCVVLIDKDAERTFISRHGAERMFAPGSLASVKPLARDWVLLSGYGLFKESGARELVPWIERLDRGQHFVFDPGPVAAEIPRGVLDRVLARAAWVTANAREGATLTGERDPRKAAEALAHERQGAIVRIGAEGCWLAAGERAERLEGFTVDTVDTNGAGDTHAGSFIAAMCLGYGPGEAAVLANAAAALSTTKRGPATAPTLAEVQVFLDARGHRLESRAARRA